jgi:predicted ester cyclase
MGIPPTNNAISLTVSEIYRIADGKITEQWVILDALGMMQQLGVIPAPGQAGS